jgi:hypothetical protein
VKAALLVPPKATFSETVDTMREALGRRRRSQGILVLLVSVAIVAPSVNATPEGVPKERQSPSPAELATGRLQRLDQELGGGGHPSPQAPRFSGLSSINHVARKPLEIAAPCDRVGFLADQRFFVKDLEAMIRA